MTEPESSLCIPTADITNDTAESTEASTPTGEMEELYVAPRLPMPPTSPTREPSNETAFATATGNSTATVTDDRRAEDFYAFFRSDNLQEIRRNLERLAGSTQLDRKDLALLALMLDRCSVEIWHHLQGDKRSHEALNTILNTVRSCPEPPDPKYVQMIQRLAQAGPQLDY